MSSSPRVIGTLIVVVLKANHLPNKRHIGKQDPYCVVSVNGEKRRTKAIKRGGQHPEWDEEIRFTLFEDNNASDQAAQKADSPARLPPKSPRGPKNIKGGKTMKVACFADDPREPDFIGEADVDLTEVLTKGETDEWFTLSNKDKFAGKVYLELTFWSNEPPPEKKVPKPQQTNKYAGPGYFNPLEDYSNSAHVASQARISNAHEQPGLGDSVSSVLRVPNPKAQPELLYDPPYLQRHRVSPLDRVSSDFGELDMSDRRTSSLNGHYINSSISSGYSAVAQQPTHSFDFSTSPEQMYVHSHDQPIIAHGQPQQPATVPNSLQPGHNSAYDPTSANGYQHSNRRPRIPISSSGFVPLHGHGALPSHPSEPTSLPSYNSTSHYPMQPYASVLSHTPTGYMQAAAPPSFASQPYQTSQPAPYPQYMPVISMPTPGMPAPTGSYVAPMSQQTPPASTPNALYVNGSAPPSPHDQMIHSPHAQAASLIANTGSRPLPPQPQANFGQSQTPSAYAASQGILPQQTGQPNSVSYQPPVPFPPTQPPPPPP
ncbi:hypothetical protein AX14_004239, partial [Amanita brunnescens Koide BX004]